MKVKHCSGALTKTLCSLTAVVSLCQGVATAALVPYATRAAFDLDYPSATIEDFEEANVADGGTALMENVLDASTNNAIFSTGDIVDGLEIMVSESPFYAENLFVSAPGFATYVSHAISFQGGDTASPQMRVSFLDGDVVAFALDLTSNPDGNTLTVDVFSGAASLGSTVVPNVQGAGTFFGVRSDSQPITHVTISNGAYFGVDNIAFSSVVPEPATAMLGCFGMLGMWLGMRRRGVAK